MNSNGRSELEDELEDAAVEAMLLFDITDYRSFAMVMRRDCGTELVDVCGRCEEAIEKELRCLWNRNKQYHCITNESE